MWQVRSLLAFAVLEEGAASPSGAAAPLGYEGTALRSIPGIVARGGDGDIDSILGKDVSASFLLLDVHKFAVSVLNNAAVSSSVASAADGCKT